jgi:hypothetical protein
LKHDFFLRLPLASQDLSPSQNITLTWTNTNIGGTAPLASLKVTNPDETISAFPLIGGKSTTVQTTWRVTPVPAREEQEETAAAYQGTPGGGQQQLLHVHRRARLGRSRRGE